MTSELSYSLDRNQGMKTHLDRVLPDDLSMTDAAADADAAKTFNESFLPSHRERDYILLKEEYDALYLSFKQQQVLLQGSRDQISELQRQVVSLDEELATQRENTLRETRRSKSLEEKDRDSQERLARVEIEADSLRQELR